MVGKLLVRGMLAGVLAGMIAFGFARVAGEAQVDQAISFEQKLDAAKGEAREEELVSRQVQRGFGLFTGVVVFGTAIGGIFSLVFAYVNGRFSRLPPMGLSLAIAAAGFVALVIVPGLKYPANPPSVGDPETIAARTALYFLAIVLSVAIMVSSISLRRRWLARLGAMNASLAAALVFCALVIMLFSALPAVNEVPEAFPATVLWNFRMASWGIQFLLWTTLAVSFGWMVEPKRTGARKASVYRV
jgi:magnesium-transporting ATPase (P-type)